MWVHISFLTLAPQILFYFYHFIPKFSIQLFITQLARDKSGQSCYWALAGAGADTGESMFPKKVTAALLEACCSFTVYMASLPTGLPQDRLLSCSGWCLGWVSVSPSFLLMFLR